MTNTRLTSLIQNRKQMLGPPFDLRVEHKKQLQQTGTRILNARVSTFMQVS